jgi:hypothetical protein
MGTPMSKAGTWATSGVNRMARQSILLGPCTAVLAAVILLVLPAESSSKRGSKPHEMNVNAEEHTRAVLWQEPADIASRNLYYGSGGEEHAPHTTYTFLEEDLNGTNPKFDVRDENGIKWKVKLGVEARPEVVASRLVWAVGYYANEDYFLPELRVEGMPPLTRGQNLVGPDGTFRNVRLKRQVEGEKKLGDWKWHQNPFDQQRQLNGLRVMMALVNNWDLKDVNNSVYEEKHKDAGAPELRYEVTDLGASFGTTGRSWTHSLSKGNLNSYQHSKFIHKITPEYVDFDVPARPALIYAFVPNEFVSCMEMRWIGRHIPISDARWIGGLLAQLSSEQIRDAFRAAGYSPEQVQGFADVVELRIAELNKL